MKSVLRVVGGLLALLLVVIGGLLVGARFADGPIAIIAGGPFTSGELVSGPEPDWSFVRDVREVQFQLLDPARSRTAGWRALRERWGIKAKTETIPFDADAQRVAPDRERLGRSRDVPVRLVHCLKRHRT